METQLTPISELVIKTYEFSTTLHNVPYEGRAEFRWFNNQTEPYVFLEIETPNIFTSEDESELIKMFKTQHSNGQ